VLSTQVRLARFFCVVVMTVVPWPPAWSAPDAKPSVTWDFTFSGKEVSLSPQLDDVLASARAERRPVMLDFYAEWCAACRLLDRNTYTAPEVILQAKRFVTIRIDVTNLVDATEVLT